MGVFIENNNVEYLKNNYIEQNQKLINQINQLKLLDISNYVPTNIILKKIFNKNNDNKNNYPFLNQYLNNESEINFLKHLPHINIISNAILKLYSHNKSAKELEDIKIEDTLAKLKSKIISNLIIIY